MDVSFAGYDIFQYSAWFDPSVSDAAIDQMRRPFWSEVVVSVGARVKGDVPTLLGAGKNCTALWKRLMVKLMNYSIWLSLTYFVDGMLKVGILPTRSIQQRRLDLPLQCDKSELIIVFIIFQLFIW